MNRLPRLIEQMRERTKTEEGIRAKYLLQPLLPAIKQRVPARAGQPSSRRSRFPYMATIVVALAAWQAHRPDLIRSPKCVLAHLWEGSALGSALMVNHCIVA